MSRGDRERHHDHSRSSSGRVPSEWGGRRTQESSSRRYFTHKRNRSPSSNFLPDPKRRNVDGSGPSSASSSSRLSSDERTLGGSGHPAHHSSSGVRSFAGSEVRSKGRGRVGGAGRGSGTEGWERRWRRRRDREEEGGGRRKGRGDKEEQEEEGGDREFIATLPKQLYCSTGQDKVRVS